MRLSGAVEQAEVRVVTLTDRVKTEAARDEAGKLARNTDGVEHVHNRIEVGKMTKKGAV